MIYASTAPAVAAAFEALRPAGQEEWASLGLWLKSDYTLATATTIVRLKPTAVPLALRDLRGFLSRSHFFDRQALPVENTLARCQILAALIGTPGRTQNWFDTILPIEVIVTALADGLTPAVAVKRFERANRQ